MKKRTNLTIILLSAAQILMSQTKIEQSKSELNSGSTTTYRSYSAPDNRVGIENSSRDLFDGEMTLQEWIVGGFVAVAAVATTYAAIGSYKNEKHLHNRLSAYPYKDRRFGNYCAIDSASAKHNMRIDINNSILLVDKNLYGNHMQTRIRPFHYAFLQIDYHQLAEYNQNKDKNDYLALLGFNVGYDRLRFGKFNFGFTLGANYVANDVKKAGFTYGIQSEAFLPHNISIAGSARFSHINSRKVNLYELKARYHLNRWYITSGYEMMKIASPEYHFFAAGIGVYL